MPHKKRPGSAELKTIEELQKKFSEFKERYPGFEASDLAKEIEQIISNPKQKNARAKVFNSLKYLRELEKKINSTTKNIERFTIIFENLHLEKPIKLRIAIEDAEILRKAEVLNTLSRLIDDTYTKMSPFIENKFNFDDLLMKIKMGDQNFTQLANELTTKAENLEDQLGRIENDLNMIERLLHENPWIPANSLTETTPGKTLSEAAAFLREKKSDVEKQIRKIKEFKPTLDVANAKTHAEQIIKELNHSLSEYGMACRLIAKACYWLLRPLAKKLDVGKLVIQLKEAESIAYDAKKALTSEQPPEEGKATEFEERIGKIGSSY